MHICNWLIEYLYTTSDFQVKETDAAYLEVVREKPVNASKVQNSKIAVTVSRVSPYF